MFLLITKVPTYFHFISWFEESAKGITNRETIIMEKDICERDKARKLINYAR